MNPLKAQLHIYEKVEFDSTTQSDITKIIYNEYHKRTDSGLGFISTATSAVEIYLDSIKGKLLEEFRERTHQLDVVEIDNIDVVVDSQQTYGDQNTVFNGYYECTLKTTEITVVAIFPDKSIAYYTEDFPSINFITLTDKVHCVVLE